LNNYFQNQNKKKKTLESKKDDDKFRTFILNKANEKYHLFYNDLHS